MKRGLIILISLFLFVATSGAAGALTISSVEGAWSNVSGTFVFSFKNDESISYGNGLEDQVLWGTPAYWWAGQSGLGFTGIAPPDSSFAIGDPFEIGQLRHFNNPIYNAATSVDLDISLTFSDPVGLNDTSNFSFTINETPNITGGSPGDDDYIFFSSSYANEIFNIDGIDYTLQLLGFGSSDSSIVSQFQSPEGFTNSTLLWGRITTPSPTPTPEPATMLLLGTGLVGLAGLGRKKFFNKN